MNPLICALAISLGLGAGGGQPGQHVSALKSVVQDDAVLLNKAPDEVRAAVTALRSLGVDRVRLTAVWSQIAPDPDSRTRPRFEAENPRAYHSPGLTHLDTAISEIDRAGMEPMVDVGFWAPHWAAPRQPRRYGPPWRWRPNAREFAAFSTALARRYNGNFKDRGDARPLPAVRIWTTWNEPNWPGFLLPQWERRGGVSRPVSPHIYRRLHEAGYGAIKGVNGANKVLIGGLASDGARRPGPTSPMAPMRFARELACVNRQLRPLRRRECRHFRPLRADGFAHHPYPGVAAPTVSNPQRPENVTFGELDRLTNLLAGLRRRGRLAQPLDVNITELGWDTNPPDRRGVSLGKQADYIVHANYIAWRNPGVATFAQFLLRDLGGDSQWQTGLQFVNGKPKPAFDAFRFPLWLEAASLPDGTPGLFAFGQVRPGSGPVTVQLESQGADGQWRALPSAPLAGPPSGSCSAAFSTAADGVFVRFIPHAGPGRYRFEWLQPYLRAGVASPVRTIGQLPPGRPPPVSQYVRPAR